MDNLTIIFENNIQKALWDGAIRGQLSDGYWENTNPYDHWKPWCNAETRVAKNGEKLGRNFWAAKDNYNLLAPVQYISEEMLAIATLATMFPILEGGVPKDLWDFNWYAAKAAEGKDWAIAKMEAWTAAGITAETFSQLDGRFTIKQLRAELSRMKKIIRTRN